MIQITKFIEPDDIMWHNGEEITGLQWIEIEMLRIERKTGKKTHKKEKRGKIAIFRERIK